MALPFGLTISSSMSMRFSIEKEWLAPLGVVSPLMSISWPIGEYSSLGVRGRPFVAGVDAIRVREGVSEVLSHPMTSRQRVLLVAISPLLSLVFGESTWVCAWSVTSSVPAHGGSSSSCVRKPFVLGRGMGCVV